MMSRQSDRQTPQSTVHSTVRYAAKDRFKKAATISAIALLFIASLLLRKRFKMNLFSIVSFILSIHYVKGAQELNEKTFHELVSSGKNGMIKFYQSWCGHCTKMKPDWDRLAEESHDSVFIADVNCGDEEDLCSENGITGYPTIKVYNNGEEEKYTGQRTFDHLMAYVDVELASKCDVDNAEKTCDDRAREYIAKWKAKDADAISKEFQRLINMQGKPMEKALKCKFVMC